MAAIALLTEGLTLLRLGRFSDALTAFDRALEENLDLAIVHCQRGNALMGMHQFKHAVESFDAALRLQENFPEALCNRGVALDQLMQHEAALSSYNEAIEYNPGIAVVYFNRGNTLLALSHNAEAIKSYDQAIRLQPNYAKAFCNRGNALQALDELKKATESYSAAIACQPDYVEAYCNRGNALRASWQFDRARADYDRAISIDPTHTNSHWNRGLLELLQGNYKDGWQGFEWRRREIRQEISDCVDVGSSPPHPYNLLDKTVLLYSEQGLGDTIMMCRYVELLANRGARVVIETPPALANLISRMNGVEAVVPRGMQWPEFDWCCSFLSLPKFFGTRVESIPHADGYLTPDLAKVAIWDKKLGYKNRLRIGLALSGNPFHQNDRRRSIDFSEALKFLPDCADYICLQKEIRSSDKASIVAREDVRIVSDELNDMDETAALVSCMDLVISVDTSVAHLSAAMGKPTWILLPHMPDWRWLLGRSDSPWYKSATLFRQSAQNSWIEPLTSIRDAIRAYMPTG